MSADPWSWRSVGGPSRNDPTLWLAGGGRDALEVSLVVQHQATMMLGHSGGQQVDDPGAAVMARCGRADLDLAGVFRDRLADRQRGVQAAAAFGVGADIARRDRLCLLKTA